MKHPLFDPMDEKSQEAYREVYNYVITRLSEVSTSAMKTWGVDEASKIRTSTAIAMAASVTKELMLRDVHPDIRQAFEMGTQLAVKQELNRAGVSNAIPELKN
jgi:hypothetical protein